MKASVEQKMNPRLWSMFLEEVRGTPLGQTIDFSSISNLNELAKCLRHSAALSESRAKREVEGLFWSFYEKIQRAA
jgi:hypothetical protein